MPRLLVSKSSDHLLVGLLIGVKIGQLLTAIGSVRLVIVAAAEIVAATTTAIRDDDSLAADDGCIQSPN